MKKLLVLLFAVSILACKKDDPKPQQVATNNPPAKTGNAVKFVSAQKTMHCSALQLKQMENVGLAYNSTDLTNNAFFASQTFNGDYVFSNIAEGVYYYKSYTSEEYTTQCTPMYISLKQQGSFTITKDSTVVINIP